MELLVPRSPADLIQSQDIKHRVVYSVLCGNLDGRGVWGEDGYMFVWLSPFAGTITPLLISYTPIYNKKFKKIADPGPNPNVMPFSLVVSFPSLLPEQPKHPQGSRQRTQDRVSHSWSVSSPPSSYTSECSGHGKAYLFPAHHQREIRSLSLRNGHGLQ